VLAPDEPAASAGGFVLVEADRGAATRKEARCGDHDVMPPAHIISRTSVNVHIPHQGRRCGGLNQVAAR